MATKATVKLDCSDYPGGRPPTPLITEAVTLGELDINISGVVTWNDKKNTQIMLRYNLVGDSKLSFKDNKDGTHKARLWFDQTNIFFFRVRDKDVDTLKKAFINSLSNVKVVKEETTTLRHENVAARSLEDIYRERVQVLKYDSDLCERHQQFVGGGICSEEEFWSNNDTEFQLKLGEMLQVKGVHIKESEVKQSNGKVIISQDQILKVLSANPEVLKGYRQWISEGKSNFEFWDKYYQSEWFHRKQVIYFAWLSIECFI
jgi:hypothetical protein